MTCLDDNAVVAYVERLLPEPERLRVAAHLDECEACLAITCAVARSAEAAAATAGPVELATEAATATAELVELATEPAAPMAMRIERSPGDAVGRYALVELIGRGAMGSVYVAHDPELDRKVALKIVRSERYAQREVRARLSREARAMARITHPHVVTVYDAGELDDGVFIAMELVEGDTLARWLATEKRSWREVVRMFVAIGRGLAAAHAAGIVHRDFKPENVLVDKHGRAAVTDFGLALAEEATLDPAAEVDRVPLAAAHELTRTGVLLGTPRYMSPEQFRGGAVDARSDQFSYAVALYDALYHQPPFAGTTVGELRATVAAGAVRARPAGTAVPLGLHRVLLRALAAAPGDRYASLDRLLEALEPWARPARWRRGGFAIVVVVAAIGVAAGVAIVGAVVGSPAPSPAPALAPAASVEPRVARPPQDGGPRTRVLVDRFTNQTGDPRLDDTLDLIVADVLLRSTRLDPRAGVELPLAGTTVDALVAKVVSEGHPAIGLHGSVARDGAGYVVALDDGGAPHGTFAATEHAASEREVAAAAGRLGARFLASLGDLPGSPVAGGAAGSPGAGGAAGSPGAIGQVLSPSLDALHAYAEGQRFSFAGEFARSVASFRRALDADPAFVDAHQNLGLTLYNLEDRVGAIAELERAKQGADRLPDRKRLTLLGDYFSAIGKYSDAIMMYQQLLARWPGDARTEMNLVATALDANSWEVALEQSRRAAKEHPEIVIVRGNLVLAELANGMFDDAVRDGAAMLSDLRQPLAASVAAIAVAQALLGRGRDARATYDKLAAFDPELADLGRADLALYEGRLDDAEALIRPYVEPAIASGKTAEIPSELIALARTRLRRGDRAGAVRAATLAMATGEARPAYVAAAVALEAGDQTGAAARIKAWTDSPLPERRLYGKLLAGDLARATARPRDAIALYQDASLISPSWMTHERLGRAYLAEGAWDDAERELTWCFVHRGEAAVFMTPALSYLPDVLLALARTKDRRHAGLAQVRAAYEAVLALAPDAQHDPITDEVRRRIAKLAP